MNKAESGESQNNKPLTLSDLTKYSSEVLLPAIDERFEKHDKRFDGIDKRFDVLEVEVGEVKKLSIDVKKLSLKVLTALDENTTILRDIRQEQLTTSATLTRHDERITKLETKAAV